MSGFRALLRNLRKREERESKPFNCHKCGRFVGKAGDADVWWDSYAGGWECGYPVCAKHKLERDAARKAAREAAQKGAPTP